MRESERMRISDLPTGTAFRLTKEGQKPLTPTARLSDFLEVEKFEAESQPSGNIVVRCSGGSKFCAFRQDTLFVTGKYSY